MAAAQEEQLKVLLAHLSTTQAGSSSPVANGSSAPIALTPELFQSDLFRIYCYKVVPCTRRYGHDWTACPFCHPGEKATRRCPQKFAYVPIACPDCKKGTDCPRGQSCPWAHNVFEYWLHPTRYRTQLCSYGTECKRSICFFAHNYNELRVVDQTQLQALERELDAAGENVGAFGFPTGGNSKQPPPPPPQASIPAANVMQQLLQMQSSQTQRDQEQQQRLLQAASLLGTDPNQLASMLGLPQPAPRPQPQAPANNEAALLQAALQLMSGGAGSSALGPAARGSPQHAAPSVPPSLAAAAAAMLLGGNGGLADTMAPATPPLAPASAGVGVTSVRNSPMTSAPAVNQLMTPLMSMVSVPSIATVPSLSASDDQMAATMKLIAELSMGGMAAKADAAASAHSAQQQQQAAAAAAAAAAAQMQQSFASLMQQQQAPLQQQASLQQQAQPARADSVFTAAAAAASAAAAAALPPSPPQSAPAAAGNDMVKVLQQLQELTAKMGAAGSGGQQQQAAPAAAGGEVQEALMSLLPQLLKTLGGGSNSAASSPMAAAAPAAGSTSSPAVAAQAAAHASPASGPLSRGHPSAGAFGGVNGAAAAAAAAGIIPPAPATPVQPIPAAASEHTTPMHASLHRLSVPPSYCSSSCAASEGRGSPSSLSFHGELPTQAEEAVEADDLMAHPELAGANSVLQSLSQLIDSPLTSTGHNQHGNGPHLPTPANGGADVGGFAAGAGALAAALAAVNSMQHPEGGSSSGEGGVARFGDMPVQDHQRLAATINLAGSGIGAFAKSLAAGLAMEGGLDGALGGAFGGLPGFGGVLGGAGTHGSYALGGHMGASLGGLTMSMSAPPLQGLSLPSMEELDEQFKQLAAAGGSFGSPAREQQQQQRHGRSNLAPGSGRGSYGSSGSPTGPGPRATSDH